MTDRPVVNVSISSTDPKYTAAATAIVAAGLTWLDHTVRPGWTAQEPELLAGSVRAFRAAGGSFAIQALETSSPSAGNLEDYVEWSLDHDEELNPAHARALIKAAREVRRYKPAEPVESIMTDVAALVAEAVQTAALEARTNTSADALSRRFEITKSTTASIMALLEPASPARAEAQDEGAAGEPVAWVDPTDIDTIAEGYPMTTQIFPAKQADAAATMPLYAHPSPTPAADDDRVREAIADVISHENDWRTALTAMDATEETPEDGSGKPGYWLHQIKVLDRILAALQSTAAKEQPPSLVEFANMVARIRKDAETGGGISNDAALDQLEKVIGFARSIVGDPGYPDLDNLPDLEEPTPDPERHPDA